MLLQDINSEELDPPRSLFSTVSESLIIGVHCSLTFVCPSSDIFIIYIYTTRLAPSTSSVMLEVSSNNGSAFASEDPRRSAIYIYGCVRWTMMSGDSTFSPPDKQQLTLGWHVSTNIYIYQVCITTFSCFFFLWNTWPYALDRFILALLDLLLTSSTVKGAREGCNFGWLCSKRVRSSHVSNCHCQLLIVGSLPWSRSQPRTQLRPRSKDRVSSYMEQFCYPEVPTAVESAYWNVGTRA